MLLNLFGSGHFISVAGKSVKDVEHALQVPNLEVLRKVIYYWLFISTLLTSTDLNIHDFFVIS